VGGTSWLSPGLRLLVDTREKEMATNIPGTSKRALGKLRVGTFGTSGEALLHLTAANDASPAAEKALLEQAVLKAREMGVPLVAHLSPSVLDGLRTRSLLASKAFRVQSREGLESIAVLHTTDSRQGALLYLAPLRPGREIQPEHQALLVSHATAKAREAKVPLVLHPLLVNEREGSLQRKET
jgi:hypothetical protein